MAIASYEISTDMDEILFPAWTIPMIKVEVDYQKATNTFFIWWWEKVNFFSSFSPIKFENWHQYFKSEDTGDSYGTGDGGDFYIFKAKMYYHDNSDTAVTGKITSIYPPRPEVKLHFLNRRIYKNIQPNKK